MLMTHYRELDDASKVIYFEVATNSSFNHILTKEKEQIEKQLLMLTKSNEETYEDFALRHARLVEQRNFIMSFLEINQFNIKQIQQET